MLDIYFPSGLACRGFLFFWVFPFGCLWQEAAKANGVPKQYSTSTQLVLVTAPWNSANGTMQQYQRGMGDKNWQKIGASIPVAVGKNGLSKNKHEGDDRTPAGVFKIGPAFGFAKHIRSRLPYQMLSTASECVNDVSSQYYNQLLEREHIANPDWHSSEVMKRFPRYRLGSVIQYNMPESVKGAGSCIFLHIWKGPGKGTAGCIAMSAEHLKQLLEWLDPARQPVIVVLPADLFLRKPQAMPIPLSQVLF